MSKIEEFEQKLIRQGMTEDDFTEYAKLLNRVSGNLIKRQYCYTTAIQFPGEYSSQAVKLIQFGLENYDDGWFSTYTSYVYIGRIYERAEEYQKAFDFYCLAKNTLGTEHPDYVREIAINLLWMKLHLDSFQYSMELEEYYLCYDKSNAFSKALLNNGFKMTVAGIVIALHHGKTEDAKQMLETAKKILMPNYRGKLHSILNRHRHNESLEVTPEVTHFIKSIQI